MLSKCQGNIKDVVLPVHFGTNALPSGFTQCHWENKIPAIREPDKKPGH